MLYRLKETGTVVTADYLKRLMKPNRSKEQIFLPNDPDKWSEALLEKIDVDRVNPVPCPAHDSRFFLALSTAAEMIDGEWHQKWELEPLWASVGDLRYNMRGIVQGNLERAQSASVELLGVSVGPDALTVAKIDYLLSTSADEFPIVQGGEVTRLSREQLNSVRDSYMDKLYSYEQSAADLIEKIESISHPSEIDLDSPFS